MTAPAIGSVMTCYDDGDRKLYEVIAHKSQWGDVVAVVVQPLPPLIPEDRRRLALTHDLSEEVSLVKIAAGRWRVVSPLELLAREG